MIFKEGTERGGRGEGKKYLAKSIVMEVNLNRIRDIRAAGGTGLFGTGNNGD